MAAVAAKRERKDYAATQRQDGGGVGRLRSFWDDFCDTAAMCFGRLSPKSVAVPTSDPSLHSSPCAPPDSQEETKSVASSSLASGPPLATSV